MHGAMSAAALLGPGRSILVSGFRSAARGAPDMNSLVSLGAVAAFGVSCVAAAMPQLAWRTFFEEPAMLLGVVLMGRTLEQRAKLQASSDMVALRVSTPAARKALLRYLQAYPRLHMLDCTGHGCAVQVSMAFQGHFCSQQQRDDACLQ